MAKKEQIKPSIFRRLLSKFLVLTVIVLVCLIMLKGNANLRDYVYKKIFQNNISFAKINEIYKKYFGSSLPLTKEEKTSLVSKENLEYTKKVKYKEGVKLKVKQNYLVPSMDSGLVIFSGEKKGYGNTVVIQRPDDVEVWYCNLKNVGVELYDYIKAGSILGEVDGDELYLVFFKEGKVIDYQKYI